MSSLPNILLITSDQQHWDTLGCFNPILKTPGLDTLAQEGTVFTRAYCPNPTCTPSRASIITGLYPSQHGAWSLGTSLSPKVPTVGDVLLDRGYETALVGKAHFQGLSGNEEFPSLESYPYLQDFKFWKSFRDRFFGFKEIEITRNHTVEHLVGQHYVLWLEEKGCKNWKDYFLQPTGNISNEECPRIETLAAQKPNGFYDAPRTWGNWAIPEEFHYNTWVAERTNAHLERYKREEKPFFLWASFADPHPEYFIPSPWDTMYDPDDIPLPEVDFNEYKNLPPHIQKTQEEFPDYSEYLVEFGLHGFHSHRQKPEELKKDIALYYGMISMMDKYIGKILAKLEEEGLKDNTIVVFTSDHGHFIGQHGLIRKGPFHFEDDIRVPMIVRYPKHVPAGKISEALQSLVDLSPTFLSFAQTPMPHSMTGKDQKEVWTGQKAAVRSHIICEDCHEFPTMNIRTYVDNRYKFSVQYNSPHGLLFDLEKDPKELHNLWYDPAYTKLKQELSMKYISAELEKESRPMPRIRHA